MCGLFGNYFRDYLVTTLVRNNCIDFDKNGAHPYEGEDIYTRSKDGYYQISYMVSPKLYTDASVYSGPRYSSATLIGVYNVYVYKKDYAYVYRDGYKPAQTPTSSKSYS